MADDENDENGLLKKGYNQLRYVAIALVFGVVVLWFIWNPLETVMREFVEIERVNELFLKYRAYDRAHCQAHRDEGDKWHDCADLP